jgi:deazaflavin-dependent oxidoreductase (nitroreductase family)
MTEFNNLVIAEFRANDGRVDSYGFGTNLVLIHSLGARSGVERVNPVASVRDGQDWLIVASAAGSPTHPAWYYNLLAHPHITVETPEGSEQVTAIELAGDDYTAARRLFDALSPTFAEHQELAGSRRLPIFRLLRRSAHENQ